MAEPFSWVDLPSCSLPGCPFPIKSLALSTCVSPQAVHFQVLDKSPLSALEGVLVPATLLLFSEKAMATHSSTLAWKVPLMEEPGGLQSLGSLSRA